MTQVQDSWRRPEDPGRIPTDDPVGTDIKQCPACAEAVKFEARICRFCGHELWALPWNEPGYADANARSRRVPEPTPWWAVALLVGVVVLVGFALGGDALPLATMLVVTMVLSPIIVIGLLIVLIWQRRRR
jgi:hypothetical protein